MEVAVMPYRLNRLFDPVSGRALDVAIDHGFFGEPSFLNGIEDMEAAIRTIVAARPDAVQLSPGLAPVLQRIHDRAKPALVLRADVANVYGSPLDDHLFSLAVPDAIEQAVRLDAVAVCVNLLQLPGRPDVRRACIENILALRTEATRYGIPLMIEPLVMRGGDEGGYLVDGDTAKIVSLVRQARELGADLIKADPTDDAGDYHQVVEVAGDIPVLVRGGGRAPDEELLLRTQTVLEQGARGIVYGRNIIQHPDPQGITAALMSVLHAGVNAAEAHDRLRAREAAGATEGRASQ
jgi:class I fructose-bisphosphate aldolase